MADNDDNQNLKPMVSRTKNRYNFCETNREHFQLHSKKKLIDSIGVLVKVDQNFIFVLQMIRFMRIFTRCEPLSLYSSLALKH